MPESRSAQFLRTEWSWVLLALFAVLLGFWWIPGDSSGVGDTYSAATNGKRAFYTAARRLLPDVRRSTSRLCPDDADTILMLGSARRPDPDEWYELNSFVRRGGTLIFAPRSDDTSQPLTGFGVRIRRLDDPLDPTAELPDMAETNAPAKTSFLAAPVDWRSRAVVDTERDVDVVVETGAGPQVVVSEFGRGLVVVCASEVIFHNKSLVDLDAAEVAFRILEAGRPSGPIYFDESLNAGGSPRVFGILFAPLFRPLTLQCLLLLVLFGWWGSRRFGPAIVEQRVRRRAIVEHARALGNMHYKVGTGRYLVKAYLDYFRTRTRLPRGSVEKVAEILAGQSGLGRAEVEQRLRAARSAVREQRQPPATVGAVIRDLADLQERLHRVDAPRTRGQS